MIYKANTPGNQFQCSKCPRAFSQGRGLARHYQASKHGSGWRLTGRKVKGRKNFTNRRKRDLLIELEGMMLGGDIAAQSNLAA